MDESARDVAAGLVANERSRVKPLTAPAANGDAHSAPLSVGLAVQRAAQSPKSVLVLILLLAFLVYRPMLGDWFQGDDFFYLRASQLTDAPEFLAKAFDFRHTDDPVPSMGGHYRPLYVITILGEAELFGLHATPYHLVSLGVHLLNTCLVWLIAAHATKRPLVAHVAALIFALHPGYVSTVAWISDHTTLLATLGALASLWCFINSLENGRRRHLWYISSLVSYVAALLYHPKVAPVLLAMVAYYYLVHRGSLRDLLSPRSWARFLPYAAVTLFAVVVGRWLWERDWHLQVTFAYGPHVYRNYLRYLGMAVFPRGSVAVTEANSANYYLAAIAMLSITGWLAMGMRGRAMNLFGLVWFHASLLPLTVLTWGAYWREFYVAGPGLALMLGLLAAPLIEFVSRSPVARLRVLAVAAAAALLILGLYQNLQNQQVSAGFAAEGSAFVGQLRETYPVLPRGGTLYVVGAPSSLALFDYAYLEPVVSLYYSDVNVKGIRAGEASAVPASLGPNERVFYYQAKRAPGD